MNSDLTCFECGEGIYEIFKSSYKHKLDNGKIIEVPDFLRYRCPKCGDAVTPDTSLQRLEDKICWGMNYVTEEEFNEFLERRNLSVSQAAELLGVYPLYIENWKHGFRHVGDSVSRLIRIFNKFDGTFEWVKNEYVEEEMEEK